MLEGTSERATFGGGCFWCLEAAFASVIGVERVVSGYSGGGVKKPSYAQVSSGQTGHAEVVRLFFNPEIVGFGELLEIFFSIHDPTTLNRQGADVGTQYRSVIFYHDAAQRETAGKVMAALNADGVFDKPLLTQLLPLADFFPAEDSHQQYYATHENQAYCQMLIAPKLAGLRQRFGKKIKAGQ